MKEAKFKIGDRIRYHGNLTGTITDILERKATSDFLYEVIADGRNRPSNCLVEEDKIELLRKEYSMQISIDIAENVVIASLYEVVGPNMRPVAKGHGHLIHEGAFGIAQAASYACMRLYKSMEGI